MHAYNALFQALLGVKQYMIFAILFKDNEEYSSRRAEFMQKHLEFLQRHSNNIQAAGPLKDASSDEPAGGLWIAEAENLAEAQRLVEEDPFWPTGLRESVTVLQWTQVFANGEKLT
jgi:uncharacterized protein